MTAAELKAARASFGLTQSEWGRWLGVGREHVAKLEAGTARPSATLVLLVLAYQRNGLK
jgi:DNA-binding transcriptional regulator YiaG